MDASRTHQHAMDGSLCIQVIEIRRKPGKTMNSWDANSPVRRTVVHGKIPKFSHFGGLRFALAQPSTEALLGWPPGGLNPLLSATHIDSHLPSALKLLPRKGFGSMAQDAFICSWYWTFSQAKGPRVRSWICWLCWCILNPRASQSASSLLVFFYNQYFRWSKRNQILVGLLLLCS